jgi:hypothetical protein
VKGVQHILMNHGCGVVLRRDEVSSPLHCVFVQGMRQKRNSV